MKKTMYIYFLWQIVTHFKSHNQFVISYSYRFPPKKSLVNHSSLNQNHKQNWLKSIVQSQRSVQIIKKNMSWIQIKSPKSYTIYFQKSLWRVKVQLKPGMTNQPRWQNIWAMSKRCCRLTQHTATSYPLLHLRQGPYFWQIVLKSCLVVYFAQAPI